MSKKLFQFLLFALLVPTLEFNLNAQTFVKKTKGNWELIVDKKPFKIKGVTFGYDQEIQNYDHYFQDLKSLGVNTIRTWATNKNTKKLLDTAQKYNIKVMVGIWMRHGKPGMEDDDHFNYLDDSEGMDIMFHNAIKTVENYQHHPAVLTWGIGNEVYLNIATDSEKEAYSKFLEKICSTIKKMDPYHPITSIEAWTFGLDWWENFVPSLDIYGLNSYGPGANFLNEELNSRKIDKPYIITEFGVTGEWDIKEKKNTIKVEPTDSQKYNTIVNGYHNWIQNKPSCLGVYVFNYASGDDFISIWLNTHYKNMFRPQYWAIREAYTGKKPLNYVPTIKKFELLKLKEKNDSWIPVDLTISDIEQDDLTLNFYYNQRTGSRKRRNQIKPLSFQINQTGKYEIQLPNEDGPIKIYVVAKDSYHNAGIASTSIVVTNQEAKKRKYLVPEATLPFYIYKDDTTILPYLPTAYMGNHKAINVNLDNQEEVHSGKSAIKISYKDNHDWYGVGFVDPANDWGTILGGYDISNAKTFSFWAKTNQTHLKATVGFGLIDKNKPYPDTAKKSKEIILTDKWKKYTIKTKKLDLSCIRSGFVLFSSSNGFPHEIYIDNIVFE
ncbi:hypothetical protein UJ101_00781 [Flavobacteriaceae bacterium UJ101]|nr:hypothetical protein UJ101_00781 [Flavobacteriaceae bacterium UJ101]